MIEVEARLRKWGRSFGIVIPMEKIKEADLREGEQLDLTITKKRNPLEENFGKIKTKKTAKELLDESDKEAWDE